MKRYAIVHFVGGEPRALPLVSLMILAMTGCGSGPLKTQQPETGQLRIVCTTGQIGEMLRSIGGSHVAVESLMGPGVDPHTYSASPADVQRLASADVIFFNGLRLEERLSDLLDDRSKHQPAYAVTHDLREKGDRWLRKVAGSKDAYDPHVWLDASLWARCVDYAATKLMEHDKAHAADYRRNADYYIAELEALHSLCQQQMAQVPGHKRILVTAHDAFGYFGGAYGMESYGLQGFSTMDKVDRGTVEGLTDLLVEHQIRAVFVESSVPDKGIQALSEACRARGHEVIIGGPLYSGALGPPDTEEGTYAGALKHNVMTIVKALKE